jgi:hypothetical protein
MDTIATKIILSRSGLEREVKNDQNTPGYYSMTLNIYLKFYNFCIFSRMK